MNIIVIFTYGISLKDWHETGILKRELKIYKKIIDDHDIKFTFITFGNSEDKKYINEKNIEVIPVYEYVQRQNNKYFRFISSFIFPFKIRKYLNNKSLIKTNQLNGVWLAIILKKLLKIPLYVRTGYNLYEFSNLEKKSLIKRTFYYQLTKIALKKADLYSVTSKEDKAFLEQTFEIDGDIKIIPNYVDTLTYEDFSNRYEDRLLTVGRVENQKNYKTLIKQLQKTEYFLDLVGDGTNKMQLQKYAEDIQTKVNFLGKIEHDKLMKIYKNYKVFVSSSLYEGNSKVILEAMASGCVVVAYENKNNKELITSGENGYLYTSEKELITIVDQIFSDKKIYDHISNNAYKKIQENNLLKNIISNEIKLYKNLINY